MSLNIKHNEAEKQFFADLEGEKAYVNYKILPQNRMEILYTFVPQRYRDHGIGAELVAQAIKFASASGLKVSSDCDFATAYLKRHPGLRVLHAAS